MMRSTTDLRRAIRSLRAAPIVTMAAILSLALGIGASTALFSLFNAMMLRSLHVSDPEGLVTITSTPALALGFQGGGGWNFAMWERFRGRNDAFGGAFAWTLQRLDATQSGEMQPIDVLFATGDLFATLGVAAVVGRTFTAADDLRGGGADGGVAVISDDFWHRRFNGARSVIGTRLLVDGAPLTIVGVTPPGFSGIDVGQGFDIAVPLGVEALIRGPRALVNNPRALLLTVMVRLRPGQSMDAATATLRSIQPDIVGQNAPAFLTDPFVLVPASTGISDRSGLRQRYERPLLTVSAVCGLVLLIVCLNVANILLARAAARRGELSVRLALGARRSDLVRQLLMESTVIAVPGALVGIAFAVWVGRLLVSQLPESAMPIQLDVSLDWNVLAFTVAVTFVAIVICGTAPAFHASSVNPIESLHDVGRGTITGRRRIGNALVVGQIAISLVLLVAAGLFVGTATRLANVALGFTPDRVVVITVNTARAAIDPAARLDLYQQLVDALGAVRGVSHVAGSQWTPLSGSGGGVLSDAGGRRAESLKQVAFNFVTPGWFAVYATPMRAGRDITRTDAANSARVAVINETLARQLFADRQALGEHVTVGPCGDVPCEVIGVVGDALYGRSLRDSAPPTIYVPLAQSAGALPPASTIRITVRTEGATAPLADLSSALRAIDSGLTYSFRRLESDVASSFAQERLVAFLATFFGAVAALLAALGLYAVTAYAVRRRRTEIGVRLALGAAPHDAVLTILRRVTVLVVIGAALGIAISIWLSAFVTPLLFGLTPHDPLTLTAAVLGVIVVATVAAWIPASRAARLDPAAVLRR
jgi:predicted permease